MLAVSRQRWDLGNHGVKDFGVVDELEHVCVDGENTIVAEVRRRMEKKFAPIPSVIKAEAMDLPDQAQRLLDSILVDYKDTSLSEKMVPNPPVRGPYGDCTFRLLHD